MAEAEGVMGIIDWFREHENCPDDGPCAIGGDKPCHGIGEIPLPSDSKPICQFGGCTSDGALVMNLQATSEHPAWKRHSCTTHALDFQAGAVTMSSVVELCEAWDNGTLQVDRPICGRVRL